MEKIIVIFVILILSFNFTLFAKEFLISDGEWEHSVPAVACNGTSFQVVWSDNRFDDWRYYGVQVEYNGTVGDEQILVGPSSNIYQNTELCSNGSDFLMVWSRYQTTGCPSYIYGQLIESSGIPYGSYFRVDLSNPGIISNNPKVCSDGTDYICVWTQGSFPFFKPVCQLIEPDGTFINTNLDIDAAINTYSNPCIAFDGSHYLCVWNNVLDGSICIKGRLLTPDGVVFGDALQITSPVNEQLFSALAYGGSEYLVVWEEYSFSTNQSHIYGQFISTDCVLTSNTFNISGTGFSSERNPKIISTGHSYLVTWQQDNTDRTLSLCGQLLNLDGNLIGNVINILSDYQELLIHYTICNSDNKYFVLWEEDQGADYSCIKGIFIDDIPVSIDDNHETSSTITISPNPARNSINIRFTNPETQDIALELYNIRGQKISTIYEGAISSGTHELYFETNIPSGMYFVSMESSQETSFEKVLFFRE
jgi:hypothetical protein